MNRESGRLSDRQQLRIKNQGNGIGYGNGRLYGTFKLAKRCVK